MISEDLNISKVSCDPASVTFLLNDGWFFMVPGPFSWFFMVPGWFFMVPGRFSWFFMVPGRFSWFFMVPGWLFMDPGQFLSFQVDFSWLQVSFHGFS